MEGGSSPVIVTLDRVSDRARRQLFLDPPTAQVLASGWADGGVTGVVRWLHGGLFLLLIPVERPGRRDTLQVEFVDQFQRLEAVAVQGLEAGPPAIRRPGFQGRCQRGGRQR